MLPITNKGMNLIEECNSKMILEERNIKEAIDGNSQLKYPVNNYKIRDVFYKEYEKNGYEKAIKKVLFAKLLKIKLKLNKFIYMIYKKMKGK